MPGDRRHGHLRPRVHRQRRQTWHLRLVKHGSHSELAHALDIVLRRYAEFSRIHGAIGRRALIEQAKGILMERHAISADDAFAGLRDRARNTNMTVAAVAEAVITSHPLFRTTAPSSQNPSG